MSDLTSTRNDAIKCSAAKAIIDGLAPGGGLYVPTTIPCIHDDELSALQQLSYSDLSAHIISLFLTDFTKETIGQCTRAAYQNSFSVDNCMALKTVDGIHFAQLYHGPTYAFKDFALTLLPHLLTEAKRMQGVDQDSLILTATSGDTGKAALNGFADIMGCHVIVFYPQYGVSVIQQKQMLTQRGDNLQVIAIQGNFDDAQRAVKAALSDGDLIAQLQAYQMRFSSANSINYGRLLPQIVYYFYSYFELVRQSQITFGETVDFVVPTGNFGNILAGYYAKQMGLPIANLVCASNQNDVLTQFFTSGIYDSKRQFYTTISPSMDILVSSNLERLLYHISSGDTAKVSKWMHDLKNSGKFTLDSTEHAKLSDFVAYSADETQTRAAIKQLYDAHGYLVDPHTAVAYSCYQQYLSSGDSTRTAIVLSTASPYKFPRSVSQSIGLAVNNHDDYALINQLQLATNCPMPQYFSQLHMQPNQQGGICAIDAVKKTIIDYARSKR